MAKDNTSNTTDLLFLYNCETTGLSIYNDHITEIAAKVVSLRSPTISQATFSSLMQTGIIASLIRHERPLSTELADLTLNLILGKLQV